MKPIGLTFKHEGTRKQGEIMLIHVCEKCRHISINRIARDDDEAEIVKIFTTSLRLVSQTRQQLGAQSIYLASQDDTDEIMTQLYGVSHPHKTP